MSVCNLLILPDRVYCYSDTMQYSNGDPAGLASPKASPSINDRFTVVTRGLSDAGTVMFDFVKGAADIHEAEGRAAAMMERARRIKAGNRPNMRLETTLIGFSDRHNVMRVSRFLLPEHGDTVTFRVLPVGLHLEPSPPGVTLAAPVDRFHERMVKLGLAQQAVAFQHGFTGMCIGGVMHATEVGRDGSRQRIAALYPGYADHAARFGDPCADAVASYLSREAIAA
ncbi:hypothetical protein [Azospirillum argentinense]|uniref:Uncharacterized protein n=1 Tax=Azospirillum argentinense TaxID=2970906 RepID=A0A5B0KLT0_9PROT|nr:hypothetical protein [Azospirillum argentinense]KAA1052955.1 hypothetical protein FH063_003362 [Azospirillum argentinense]